MRTLIEGSTLTPSDRWDRLGLFSLLATIGMAPFLASDTFLVVLAFLGATLAAVSRAPARALPRPGAPLAFVAAGTLLAIIQLLPLPERMIGSLASANLQIYHEMGNLFTAIGQEVPRARVSIAPAATAGALLSLLALVAVAFTAVRVLRRRARRRLFAWLVASAGAGNSVVLGARLGIGRWAAPQDPRPMDLAGLSSVLGVAFFVALGLLWAEILTGHDADPRVADAADRATRRFARLTRPAAALLVMGMGLLLTSSDGTLFAAGTSVLFTAAAGFLPRLEGPRRGARGVAFGSAIAIAALLLVAASGRRSPQPPAEIRGAILSAWRSSPWIGSGLATFPDAFRRHQPRSLIGLVDHAPSDALQVLVTTGAAGLALCVGGSVMLLATVWRASRRQRHREETALCLGSLAALLFFVLQGVSQVNLSAGPALLTLAGVWGLAWTSANAHGLDAK